MTLVSHIDPLGLVDYIQYMVNLYSKARKIYIYNINTCIDPRGATWILLKMIGTIGIKILKKNTFPKCVISLAFYRHGGHKKTHPRQIHKKKLQERP